MKHIKYFSLFSLLLIIAYVEMIGLSEGVYRYGLQNNTFLYLSAGLFFCAVYLIPVEKPIGFGH